MTAEEYAMMIAERNNMPADSEVIQFILTAYNAGYKKGVAKAREIVEHLLPFEHVIDPYAFTSDIKENKRRFHEPFRKAEKFLKEVENDNNKD